MKTLTFVNSKGDEIIFSNSPPFILQSMDISNSVNIYNSKGVSQQGMTYIGNTLDIKDITLEVGVMTSSFEEATNCRKLLNIAFNPLLDEGYLIYADETKTRKIKCIVNKLPYYDKDSDATLQNYLISLTASNPYFMDLLETKTEIALWVGTFHFPLEIISGGVQMGYRSPSLIIDVINNGEISCGMRIQFVASATVVNPSIININNPDEYIKILKTMVAGEIIDIYTYFGNKKIISNINGVETNIFNNIDFLSTFLQLGVGDNLYRYNADSGIDNLNVSIYFQPMYLGV